MALENIRELSVNPFLESSEQEKTDRVSLSEKSVFHTLFKNVDLNGIRLFYLILSLSKNRGHPEWVDVNYEQLSDVGIGKHSQVYKRINAILMDLASTYHFIDGETEWVEAGLIANSFKHQKRSKTFSIKIQKEIMSALAGELDGKTFVLYFKDLSKIKLKSELKLLEVVTAFMLSLERDVMYLTFSQMEKILYLEQRNQKEIKKKKNGVTSLRLSVEKKIPSTRIWNSYFFPVCEKINRESNFRVSAEKVKKNNVIVGAKLTIERKK